MFVVMPARGIPIFFFALYFMMVGAFTAAIFVEKQTVFEWALIVASYTATYLIFKFLLKRQKANTPLLNISLANWVTAGLLGSCVGIVMVLFG